MEVIILRRCILQRLLSQCIGFIMEVGVFRCGCIRALSVLVRCMYYRGDSTRETSQFYRGWRILEVCVLQRWLY